MYISETYRTDCSIANIPRNCVCYFVAAIKCYYRISASIARVVSLISTRPWIYSPVISRSKYIYTARTIHHRREPPSRRRTAKPSRCDRIKKRDAREGSLYALEMRIQKELRSFFVASASSSSPPSSSPPFAFLFARRGAH